MIKSIKKAVFGLLFVSIFLVPAASANAASVEVNQNLCGGANLNFSKAKVADCNKGKPEQKLNDLIEDIINIFSIVVGISAVIALIYGGFRYVIAGGDSGDITTSRNTVIYALVGLVIVVFAQVVVKFILGKVTD